MNDLDIKKIREKLGISQEQLAEMVGVHPRTVQNWESGSTIPKSKHAILRDLVLKPQRYAEGGQQKNQGNDATLKSADVEMQSELSKMIDLLASKELSLQKTQEHIDKLLEIISNLTKGEKND